jgi:hypothetical protein
MHAVWIEAGGLAPLPRAGGALPHAVGSTRNLHWHCQAAEIHGQLPYLQSYHGSATRVRRNPADTKDIR